MITTTNGIPVPSNALLVHIEPKRTLEQAKKHALTVWGRK